MVLPDADVDEEVAAELQAAAARLMTAAMAERAVMRRRARRVMIVPFLIHYVLIHCGERPGPVRSRRSPRGGPGGCRRRTPARPRRGARAASLVLRTGSG